MGSEPKGPPVARLQAQVALLLQTLRNWPWFDTLHTLRQRFGEDRLGVTAGSLTFTTLIALVPLVTVMLAVFTAFPMFAGVETALQKYFLKNLVPDGIALPVLRSLTTFSSKARGVGTVGLVLLVITALAMALTIDRALNAIWRVRRSRHFAQRILVYWAGLTLGPLVLGVSVSLTSYAVSASRGLVTGLPGGVGLLLEIMQFLMFAGATAAMFHYVPNTSVLWRHAWAGGLFVAAAFEGAKKALAWYVDAVPTFSAVYGAFATLPILLLWVYLAWVIVLMGAVIAAYAPSLQMRVAARPAVPGWRFELALAVLRLLDAARHAPQRGLSLADLSEALRADPLQLEPVVDLLAEMDWVQRLDEGGSARHVLLCDPARTPLFELMNRTLLAPSATAAGFRRSASFEKLMLADALGG